VQAAGFFVAQAQQSVVFAASQHGAESYLQIFNGHANVRATLQ
jgi:hypothetical protein